MRQCCGKARKWLSKIAGWCVRCEDCHLMAGGFQTEAKAVSEWNKLVGSRK